MSYASPSDPVSDRRYYPSLLFASDRAARVRIALTYGWRHRRFVHPHRPRRFTDWIQWRKLYDRDPRMPALADKVAVKRYVADMLGDAWVTPTLHHADELPETAGWPAPFVVKSRHGCNQCAFVRTGAEDWSAIRAAARKWVRGPYGQLLDEWLYKQVPTGVLVEPFIGAGGALPIDYKIYVFGGRAACVKVDRDREHGNWRSIHALDWQPIWAPPGASLLPPPASLEEMIAAAETLGRDFDFVRVDFYEIDGRPRFGEMTFYPGSGLSPLPDELDHRLGSLWTKAWLERRARERGRVAEGRSITHHGELLQGAVRDGAGGVTPCLVSLPRRDRVATGKLELASGGALEVRPAWKRKARRAAELALSRWGTPGAGGLLTLSSPVEAGLGLGSSTADVVAAVRAVATALGVEPRAEEVARIAVEAETASDPLMFDGFAMLFAQRSGEVLEHWGDWYPGFAICSANVAGPGTRIDTLWLPPPAYSEAELDRFAEILELARDGFRWRDLRRIAAAATQSAMLNRSRLPLHKFETWHRLADEAGALGVQIAHSGVVAGALFDPGDPRVDERMTGLASAWRAAGGDDVERFRVS
jgi:uncharacterized protein involved in propanediol utilization